MAYPAGSVSSSKAPTHGTGQPPVIVPAGATTVELPPIGYKVPESIQEVLSGGSSALGYSMVSSFLSCPHAAQLKMAGVRKKGDGADLDGFVDMSGDALAFGSAFHALRAVRLVHGMAAAFWCLGKWNIDEASRMKLNNILRLYDSVYPLGSDPWQFLGIEVEVRTHIGDGARGPIIRSVRYDSVIKAEDGALFSFECKTASRSGESTLAQYTPQAMTHAALWNANPALVAKYGKMRGTIYDLVIKTEVPKCERIGPKYISAHQEALALTYLRLPDQIAYPENGGLLPRMLHQCWGKYRPCEYIALCHEGAHGDYEFPAPA